MSKALTAISKAELAKHNNGESLHVAINGSVYDLTKFQKLHPGGKAVLIQVAGTDATEMFYQLHKKEILEKYHKRLVIGTVEGFDEKKKIPLERELISKVPYAEAPMLRSGWVKSPYLNETHIAFQKACRKFVREEL